MNTIAKTPARCTMIYKMKVKTERRGSISFLNSRCIK